MTNVAKPQGRASGWLGALVLTGVLAVGCETPSIQTQGFLNGPAGLALAGPAEAPLLFIANTGEDALQVGIPTADRSKFDFVRSATRYLPLRIPVGRAPTDLAATPDGRYVLALSTADRRVDLVSADPEHLAVARDATGTPIVWDLQGDPAVPNSAPAALIAAPTTRSCSAPCLGRFYVSLSGAGQVVELEVTDAPALQQVAAYDVGGAPTALAADPNGTIVYISDAAAVPPRVARLDVEADALLSDVLVDETPGAIAVSTDGSVLAIVRPAARDLLLVHEPAGAATRIDANAPFAPKSACLPICGEAPTESCTPTSPFERAICARPERDGLDATGEPEPGTLYLGTVASHLLPLAGALTAPCDGERRVFDQSFLVAGVEGLVRAVGIHEVGAADVTPVLITQDICQEPQATREVLDKDNGAGIADPQLDEYLGACPSAPDRARFYCTGDPGVVVLPGQLAPASDGAVFRFDWEGIVVSSSSGRFVGPNVLVDGNDALANANLRPGDTLVVRTQPQGDTCGFTALCEAEVLITDVTRDGTTTTLTLTEAFDFATCYGDLNVRYEVRATNQYLLGGGTGNRTRVNLGEVFGPGGVEGGGGGALFVLAPATSAETGEGLPSCERYEEVRVGSKVIYRSTLGPESQRRFSRERPFAMRVTDPLNVVTAGQDLAGDVTPRPPLGRLPGALLLVSPPGGVPTAFMTYTGSNRLLLFSPFETENYDDRDAYNIIN